MSTDILGNSELKWKGMGLKLNIQNNFMANRQKVEAVTDFIFLGSKITADSDCSQEIKRHLLLGRKAVKNLDSVLKSRDITLPSKTHIVKAMVFQSHV